MTNIFEDTRLRPELRAGLAKIGFKKATKVQSAVIPAMLDHQSVIVQAATGSGKTHAYLLPLLNDIDPADQCVQAIVTAPSRELADQLYQVARQLRDASGLAISIAHLAGGSDRDRQIAKFAQNKPQLIVATPGRLLDFADKKILVLDRVKNFVIDEADMTLDMGFLSDVDKVAARLPKDVVMSAFSATIPVKLANFLRKYMAKPQEIVIDNPAVIAPTIKNDLLDIGSKDRKKIVYQLLTMGQPYLALVFANTKQKVDELAAYLSEKGLRVAKIHGGITERERKRTLREVRNGQFQYLVASDLAARGIDIDGVSLVINYEIPKDLEFMIHRIGRTGRNGLPGHAVTLIREEEMDRVAGLEKMGVHFDFVEIKGGELTARSHYRRRDNRKATKTRTVNAQTKGIVAKAKRKKKPGYKKKIKRAIQEDNRQQRKLEQRHEMRHQKRLRKRKREQGR